MKHMDKLDLDYERFESLTVKAFGIGGWGAKIAATLVSLFVSFFGPLWPFLALVGVLMLADTYTGWRASVKQGRKFSSDGLKGLVQKFVLYALAIILSESVTRVFGLDDIWGLQKLTYLVSGVIAWREFQSNLENISIATGFDLWDRVKDIVGSIFNRK